MSKFYEHITESVWADIHRRSNGTQERQEDNVNNLSIDGFLQYLIDNYRGIVYSFDKNHYCKNFDIDIVVNTNKNTIIYGSYIGEELSRLMVVFTTKGMVKLQMAMKRMKKMSSDVFAVSDYDDTYSNEPANDRFFITSKYGGTVSNSLFVKLIDFLLDNKINESVWADIHRRSNGEQVRKEDELSQEAYDNLDGYLYYYAYKIVSEHAKDNLDGLCDYLMDAHKNDPDIDAIVQYVKDNWENEVAEWLSGWVEQANYDYKMDMEESVWVDIHKRSNGDLDRTEDIDFDFLKALISMMKNAVRIASDPKNRPYIDHIYSDDCDGLVEYILKRRDEHRFIDGSGKEIPKNEYDKLIRFVKNNWGDCKGINEFSDKIFGKLNECDGVPGGATPANVGGMGAAYFPGPNGEPGSGDLPSPTGIVYQQVAPFGVFIKDLKKKKKKKKFRKEDEPCVHSPNAKVYDYVDDFREYVDRTYNNIDRRK